MSVFRNRYALGGAAVIVIAGAILALRLPAFASADPAAAVAQAAQVDVAEVIGRKIVDWQSYSGRLEAVDRVEIRSQVPGALTAVHFQDGSLVRKGDVLFTIDPRPYAAEVARAEAQLAATRAREAYTASDVARAQRLLTENAIARRDYEEKQNAAREAAANVLAARAAVTQARLNLDYTRITAPVAGRISRAQVTLGNVVAAGAASAPLTTLVSVARMYASFDVDEQSFLKFVNPARVDGKSKVPVYLGLANEPGHSRQGVISSVDNRLDTSSGTIRVRAVFDNPDGVLIPGLYARIRLGSGAPREALLVDEKAIGTDQDKRFVLVLDETGHTAYREVRLGAGEDGLRVVESGLQSGEKIVVNGLQRVRPGDAVTPRLIPMQAQVPAAAAAPHGVSRADESDAGIVRTAAKPQV